MSIRSAIAEISPQRGRELVEHYFAPGMFTGASFEALGRNDNPPDRITASDLYAVSTLAVTVPAKAGIHILGSEASTITDLLERIPLVDLGSLTEREFDDHLGIDSPAMKLWDVLRRNGAEARWGIGPTTASKIMARKRPRLIPIQDSVVDHVIGRGRDDSWRLWWEALTVDDDLLERADEFRGVIGRPDLSTLRVLDIVLWMHGKGYG